VLCAQHKTRQHYGPGLQGLGHRPQWYCDLGANCNKGGKYGHTAKVTYGELLLGFHYITFFDYREAGEKSQYRLEQNRGKW
jgi:hypothetical protein